MDFKPTATSGHDGNSAAQANSTAVPKRTAWQNIKARILGGLFFVLPIALTFWVVHWLYTYLELKVIDPVALVVLWKINLIRSDKELPEWFENYVAPLIAVFVVLLLLYFLGFFVNTRLRKWFDWLLLRVPVISVIYDAFRSMFQALDKPKDTQPTRPMVLVSFPHTGAKVPAFVTATCKDIETQKTIFCLYVPTTPIPTSGFFLVVPEEEVTELNWSTEQTLQAIMSGGLTAPPEVRFYKPEQVHKISFSPPSPPVLTKEVPPQP